MEQQEDEISLIDLLVVLLKHWKLIVVLPIVALALATGYNLIKPTQKNERQLETFVTITVPPLVKQLGGLENIEDLISTIYLKDIDVLYTSTKAIGLEKVNGITLPDNSDEARYIIKKLFIEGKTPQEAALKDNEKPYVVSNSNGVITITVRFKDKEQNMNFLDLIIRSVNTKVNDLFIPIAKKEVQDYETLLVEGSKSASYLFQNSLAVRYTTYSAAQRFIKGEQSLLIVSSPVTTEIPEASSKFTLIIMVSLIAALFFAIFLAFVLEAIENIKKDPEAMAKIRSALQGNKK